MHILILLNTPFTPFTSLYFQARHTAANGMKDGFVGMILSDLQAGKDFLSALLRGCRNPYLSLSVPLNRPEDKVVS